MRFWFSLGGEVTAAAEPDKYVPQFFLRAQGHDQKLVVHV